MAPDANCPDCGAVIPDGQPKGLCARCALNGLLKPADPGDALLQTGAFSMGEAPQKADNTFGDYELLGEIARGGMGVVYRARQHSLQRTVALKVIGPRQLESSTALQRFHAEAAAAAQLDHPHIVPVYEVGECRGRHFFTMKLVEGRSLAEHIRNGNFVLTTDDSASLRAGLRRVAQLMNAVAEAVHYAHQRGILHRDLKPGNILLDAAGQPHVTDFGLAKRVESESDLTESGDVMGTPTYMAPEQAAGQMRQVTTAADVYSLGVILYELLTGVVPFRGGTPLETLDLVRTAEPVEPRLKNPRLPADLGTICLKCLEKDPARRYATAQELAVELGCFLRDEPIQSRPAGRPEKLWRWCRRHPPLAALMGAVVVLLAAVVIGSPVAIWRIDQERIRAEGLATKEAAQRQHAEEARARTAAALVRLEFQTAAHAFAADDPPMALAHLARLVRQNPSNEMAASRLLSALSWRSFPLLAVAPVPLGGKAEDVSFEASGSWAVVASAAGTNPGVQLRCWDLRRGEAVSTFSIPYPIRWAVASPDGRRVVTVAKSQSKKPGEGVLWDARTGARLLDLFNEVEDPQMMQFSPDGRYLVVVGGAEAARLWDLRGDPPRAVALNPTESPNESDVIAAQFSQDGRQVLTLGTNSVWLWETETGLPSAVFRHADGAFALAELSPDGQRVVGVSRNRMLRVWDTSGAERMAKPLWLAGEPASVQWNPDGRSLLIALKDGTVQVCDSWTGETLMQLPKADDAVTAQFSRDGSRILTLGQDRTAVVWDATTGQALTGPMRHNAGIRFARFSPDGQQVLTVTLVDVARVWDVRPGAALVEKLRHPEPVSLAQFADDTTNIFVIGNGVAQLWDARLGVKRAATTDRLQAVLREPTARDAGSLLETAVRRSLSSVARTAPRSAKQPAAILAVSSDDQHELIVLTNGLIQVRDAAGGVLLGLPLAANPVPSALFSPEGETVVLSSGKTARLWAWRGTNRPIDLQPALPYGLTRFSPDGRWVATAYAVTRRFSEEALHVKPVSPVAVSTGEVRIWNVATGALVSRLPDVRGLWTVDFSRDGRRLLTGHAYDRAVDEGWTFQVWEVATGRRLGQVPSSLAFVPAQWSDDGRKLVVAARSKIVRVWDVDSGLPLTSPMKHQGALTSVEFSPDGSRVLTSSADSTARLWDATTGLALAEPMSHAGPVTSARFSADGQWVATTAGREARVWETAPGFGPAPAWLAALAEAIGGLRFDDRGVIEPVAADELSGLRNALADAPAVDAYARWAAWFFADRGTRNISVRSSLALPEYVRRRVEIGGPKALEEALRLCPTNAAALARLTPLRQERNMVIRGLGTGQKIDGRRSEIWRRRAELLAQRGSLAEALDTLEEGARSHPLEPEIWYGQGRMLERAKRLEAAVQAYSKAIDLTGTNGVPVPKNRARYWRARGQVLRQLGRPTEALRDFFSARNILARSTDTPSSCLDLTQHYNAALGEDWHGSQWVGNNLATLPTGRQIFGGVEFDVRGILQLGSPPLEENAPGYPIAINGISLAQSCRRLHFLQATGWGGFVTNGTLVGRYVIHYQDGVREEIPLRNGEDFLEWQGYRAQPELKHATIVWRGRNGRNAQVQLFKKTWVNPRPDAPIASLDFVSAKTDAAPFLIAITAE